MDFVSSLIIAVGLAMDAFAVSVSGGVMLIGIGIKITLEHLLTGG